MIKAIIFDFGGVLTTKVDEVFKQYEEVSGVPAELMSSIMLGNDYWNIKDTEPEDLCLFLTGKISEREYFEKLNRKLNEEIEFKGDISRLIDTILEGLAPNEEMIGLVKELKKSYKVALLTNNVKEWMPHWEATFDLNQLFDIVVDSSRVAIMKPNPKIYRLSVNRLCLEPEECIFIDDRRVNLEPARNLGIKVIFFTSAQQCKKELKRLLDD